MFVSFSLDDPYVTTLTATIECVNIVVFSHFHNLDHHSGKGFVIRGQRQQHHAVFILYSNKFVVCNQISSVSFSAHIFFPQFLYNLYNLYIKPFI